MVVISHQACIHLAFGATLNPLKELWTMAIRLTNNQFKVWKQPFQHLIHRVNETEHTFLSHAILLISIKDEYPQTTGQKSLRITTS